MVKTSMRLLLLLGLVLFAVSAPVFAATLVYVPIDDRPVCLKDPVETLQAAGINIVTPPLSLLASRGKAGDPDGLWQWLQEAGKQADAVIVSTDTMLYGGLVPSRTHSIPDNVLRQRLENFQKLRQQNPGLRLYGFSTVMRSPQGSAGGTDPIYMETHGWQIFRYSALLDKQEQVRLSKKEQHELERLAQSLPEDMMADWSARRTKNYQLNLTLLQWTKAGLFQYFVLGRDDNARYSQTQKELRHLLQESASLSPAIFATFPGADQLGMVLLTRAVNDLTFQMPFVAVQYARGAGEKTIPSYQGETLGATTLNHIVAAGGFLVPDPERADLVLFVNTPENGKTPEAGRTINVVRPTAAVRSFVSMIEKQVGQGKQLAVADVAFANGADNSLMQLLAKRNLLGKIDAYSGWNTASNTVGFAISQGMLSAKMSNQDKNRLLTVRFLDDWAYQSNVRPRMLKEVLAPLSLSDVSLGVMKPALDAATALSLHKFAASQFGSFPVQLFQASHPWNRMFEVRIDLFSDNMNQ